MNNRNRHVMPLILAVILLLGMVFPQAVFANGQVVRTVPGVTAEMCGPDYWAAKLPDKDKVLMTHGQIDNLNKEIVAAKGTYISDLTKYTGTFDAAALREALLKEAVPTRQIYVDGVQKSNEEYFGAILKDIEATAWKDTSKSYEYAVAVRPAALQSWPCYEYIGYSAEDSDDELTNYSLNVNEPFVIKQACTIKSTKGEHVYYYGLANSCSGWVCGDDLAVCASYEEWLDSWQVNSSAKDFIVVLQDRLYLEPSVYSAYSNQLQLTLGTVLKLVPAAEMPENIKERGAWNNYVVYLPTRDADGKYVKQMALVSQHCDVSVGYPDMTQKNILDIAFSCLGNRYGWGGMLASMDCSLYTRTIYKCFGLELPRNTSWQPLTPGACVDLKNQSDAEKLRKLSMMPAGTMLYFPGHTMVYLGMESGKPYVISAVGSMYTPEGDMKLMKINGVAVNPLSVRRGSGLSWLSCLTSAVCPAGIPDFGSRFADVPADYWGLEAVEYAADHGIFGGYTDGTFRPDSSITRAMMVQVLYNIDKDKTIPEIKDEEGNIIPSKTFTDVKDTDWFAKAVNWAAANGVTAGRPDGSFDCDAVLNNETAITLIWNYLGRPEGCGAVDDANVSAWAADAMKWAVCKNIIPESMQNAKAPASRAQIAYTLMKCTEND